jgi:hypothetical protein
MSLQPARDEVTTLADVIDRVLDKGLVINADICVSLAGVELLGIKIRAAVASFETAARYGLEFPGGPDREKAAWKDAEAGRESCPQCGKKSVAEELLNEGCPWCGWISARARKNRVPSVEELLA